jgi:hypothetical protein
MPNVTDSALVRMRDSIYIPATQRRDCCAGCKHSHVTTAKEPAIWCKKMAAEVGKGAICAQWKPAA